MLRILICGIEGMLGREVISVFANSALNRNKFVLFGAFRGSQYRDIVDTSRFTQVQKFNALDFENVRCHLDDIKPDIIINCIGVIKQREGVQADEMYLVNSVFPRVIQHWALMHDRYLVNISTDCVYDGSQGPYSLDAVPSAIDPYGLSKRLGEVESVGALTIRTSIVGHSIGPVKLGLLDWFLAQTSDVNGFTNAFFSGVTTVKLADFLLKLVGNGPTITGIHNLAGPAISKFHLLEVVSEVYSHSVGLHPVDNPRLNKCLTTSPEMIRAGYLVDSWSQMLEQLAFGWSGPSNV